MTDHVTRALDGGVLTLSLNRPEKRNALTDAMYGALADGLRDGAADPAVKVVLIRGEGDAFSGGNDIGDFMQVAMTGKPQGEMNVFRVLDALAAYDKPIVAAVKGHAVGIGLTLLLHCDLVYAADDSKISAPFVNLALAPEAASSVLLPLRVGHVRAFSMFGLGEVIDGRTAVAWGLANGSGPAADVDGMARAAAEALALRPPGSLAATKRLMRDVEAMRAAMARENGVWTERLYSAEAREAFSAFIERRAPDFSKAG
jgi:enoyl-CoA hydratase/carnithine racemase